MKDKNGPSLKSFFLSLLPDMEKRRITTTLTHGYEELNQIVAPMYNLDVRLSLKGSAAERLDYVLKRNYSGYNGNIFLTIRKAIGVIAQQENDVFKMIDNAFSDKIIKSVIDYKGLNILRYAEALDFFNEYSRRFIQAIIIEEFGTAEARMIMTPVDKANTQWVTNDQAMMTFAKVIEVLTMDVDKFLKSIKDLEGHTFNPDDYEATKSTTGRKLDPHMFGLLPVQLNVVYHIGLLINGWAVARHERNKEELAKVQLTIMALRQKQDGNLDDEQLAKIEKQIKYHSNRANKLSAKIEAMEEGD